MDSTSNTSATRDFIRALFADDDRVALLAVGRQDEPSVHQRLLPAGDARAGRYQRWLRHLNANDHDIFVGMNPMTGTPRSPRPGARPRPMREKQDVVEVRRLQLDLDDAGPDSLRQVLADAGAGRLPQPAIVVRSSENRYQVLWHADAGAWSPDQAEDTMARLAAHYGGDPAVADVSRVMRLPGFRNKKPGRGDAPVTWTDYGGRRTSPEAFEHLPPVRQRREPGQPRRVRPRGPRPLSQSERDWAAVKDELRRGADPAELVSQLERTRDDKPNPRYYAERTVQRAVESLELERSARAGPER